MQDLLTTARKSMINDQAVAELADDLNELRAASEKRKLSSMSQDDAAPLLDEFRSAFQEVSRWIHRAEAQLG